MPSSRRRAWADTIFTGSNLINGGEIINDIRGSLVALDTMTVVRLIVGLRMTFGVTNELESHQIINFGVGVTSFEAFTAGVVPNPSASIDYPRDGWLYVATRSAYQTLPSGASVVTMHRQDAVFEVDMRASRKVDRGILYSVMENDAFEGSAEAVKVTGRIRALFLT